jgi:hypothetical protein
MFEQDMRANVHEMLQTAIGARRLVAFTLNELPRVAEPHDYGVKGGVRQLLFYQVGGESSSRAPVGWRRARVAKISRLEILAQRFTGSRDSATDRHLQWDELFATVSKRK